MVHPRCRQLSTATLNKRAWHLRDLETFDPNDPEVGLCTARQGHQRLLVVPRRRCQDGLGNQLFNKTTPRSFTHWDGAISLRTTAGGRQHRADPKDRLRMKVFDPASKSASRRDPLSRALRVRICHLVHVCSRPAHPTDTCTHEIHRHPLSRDERYGGTEILRGQRSTTYRAFIQNCFRLCDRQALHAKTLGFAHPTTGQQMDFDSEWPQDFAALIGKWRAFIKGTTQDTFAD